MSELQQCCKYFIFVALNSLGFSQNKQVREGVWSSLQAKEGQRRSEFRLVGLEKRRTYNPVIIKRTICLVLGSSTALYISFLERRTLTNEVVGTIWRDLPNLIRGDNALILGPSDC